jgi:hypothetical protein
MPTQFPFVTAQTAIISIPIRHTLVRPKTKMIKINFTLFTNVVNIFNLFQFIFDCITAGYAIIINTAKLRQPKLKLQQQQQEQQQG